MNTSGQEWEVEKILQRGRFKNTVYYLVLWKGYPREQATWEPITNLEHCKQAITEFENEFNKIAKNDVNKRERGRRMNFRKIFQEPEAPSQCIEKIETDKWAVIPEQFAQRLPLVVENEHKKQLLAAEKAISSDQPTLEKEGNGLSSNNLEEQVGKPEGERVIQTKKRVLGVSDQQDQVPSVSKPSKKIKENKAQERIDENEKQQPASNENISQSSKFIAPQEQDKEMKNKRLCLQVLKEVSETTQNEQLCSLPSQTTQKCSNEKQIAVPFKQIVKQDAKNKVSFGKQQIQNLVSKPSQKLQTKDLPNEKKEKNKNFISRNLSRYEFCDREYEIQQRGTLMNILRKATGQEKLKSKTNLLDISKNPEFLQILTGIRKGELESSLNALDILIKIDYGWIAIGRNTENHYIMIDVNLIKEDSWTLIQKTIKRKMDF